MVQILLIAAMVGLCVAWGVLIIKRHRKLINILHSIIESTDQLVLFYDEHGRIVYYSSGLAVFDRKSIDRLERLDRPPMLGQDLGGELEIDSNVYRYTTKLLEYKPKCQGTLILLDYIGPKTAK